MSWGVSPWVYSVWDSLGFLDLVDYFLPHFRDVFNYYLPKYFLMDFLFIFFFWDSCDLNVGAFNIVPEVSEVVLISFILFYGWVVQFYFLIYTIYLLKACINRWSGKLQFQKNNRKKYTLTNFNFHCQTVLQRCTAKVTEKNSKWHEWFGLMNNFMKLTKKNHTFETQELILILILSQFFATKD